MGRIGSDEMEEKGTRRGTGECTHMSSMWSSHPAVGADGVQQDSWTWVSTSN